MVNMRIPKPTRNNPITLSIAGRAFRKARRGASPDNSQATPQYQMHEISDVMPTAAA